MYKYPDIDSFLSRALNSKTEPGVYFEILQFGYANSEVIEVEHEMDLEKQFNHYVSEITSKLGVPNYKGAGPRKDKGSKEPNKIFSSHRNSLECAWWKVGAPTDGSLLMLAHTGHDADSLQAVIIETSNYAS